MGLLPIYVLRQNKDDDQGTKIIQEINSRLHDLPEMKLRIERLATLANTKGDVVSNLANEVFTLIETGSRTKVFAVNQIREQNWEIQPCNS